MMVVEVKINNDGPIAKLMIQRMTGTSEPESMNDYWYEVIGVDGFGVPQMVAAGQVRHRYGDGALSLLSKVCVMADL